MMEIMSRKERLEYLLESYRQELDVNRENGALDEQLAYDEGKIQGVMDALDILGASIR